MSTGSASVDALPLDVIMRGMSQGTFMYKVRSVDHYYKRKYKIDLQNMRLEYLPSRKPMCGKVPSLAMIDLYDVEDVRRGWGTDVFNKVEAKIRRRSSFFPLAIRGWMKEENCFSIIRKSNKILNLVAPNKKTRDSWVRGLQHLLATCKNVNIKNDHDKWLKSKVREADVNGNGSLTFNECLKLLNQINISMDKEEVRKLFDSANFRKSQSGGEDALDPDEFLHFYDSLTRRPELEEIMRRYSVSKTPILGADELRRFFSIEQKVELTTEDCENLIDHYEPEVKKENQVGQFEPEVERIQGYITLKGFQDLMLSVEGHIMCKRHRIIYQDMTHPLSHYFIASSHNTYLLQGQLVGQSSIEGYVQALLRGCRCLELDTWDGPDNEPIIFHGYTLTSRIYFHDVLEAIKKHAFRSSQYPVILSIENHCSVDFQIKMAEHFVNILGDYLYKEPIGEHETDFPSPEALARKILIKAKKIDADDEEMMREEEIKKKREVYKWKGKRSRSPSPSREDCNLAKELSDLVNYCNATKFTSFEDSRRNWKFHEMASFKETRATKLCTQAGAAFVAHNKKHLSRIYPKGTRTDSSNYDPLPFWNVGCQLVALNYQTWDKHMYMNESKFVQNGRCGYILKPRFLYDPSISYDPNDVPDTRFTRSLLIKVISGQHIPKPGGKKDGEVVDPYVSIYTSGHKHDGMKRKTKYIPDNGFNPVWNENLLLFVYMPELALITFNVKDKNFAGTKELLGQYTIPFTSIEQGYRHIHLEDSKGESLFPASLFVHVTIGEPKTYKKPPYRKLIPSFC